MTTLQDNHWKSLRDRIRVYFVRRVSSRERAEDLLQETLLRIVKQTKPIGTIGNIEAWAIRIARNVLVDDLRRRKEVPADVSNVAEIESESSENLNSEVGQWLIGYLEELPNDLAEAVRLADLEGVSQKEAAEKIGISYSGFKSRVQRGRAMIKDLIQKCCRLELDTRGNVVDYTSRDCEKCNC